MEFGDDVGYQSPLGSASSSSSGGYNETSPVAEQQDGQLEDSSATELSLIKVRRKPMPRKGHTKSRRGCFSCKKRKIKCQETLPKCQNCIKAGMLCEYPKRDISTNQIPTQDPILQPQAMPTIFTFNDMKYFHYFLIRAYPHLPVGADSLWTLDIPAQAHECDYLMHSILGLGASRLALTTPDPKQIQEQALAHRIKAVNGLNDAFMRPVTSSHDADARFATLMNLTFQSACITDGLADFMTMLRGCVLQGAVCESHDTSFRAMDPKFHMNLMMQRFQEMNLEDMPMDRNHLDRGMESLNALEEHCQHQVEITYLTLLKKLVQDAYESPSKAYFSLTQLYNIVGTLSPEDFKVLMDLKNPVCQILIGHFLAVHVITRPIAILERPNRDASVLFDMLETWVCLLHANLDGKFRRLHEWPMSLMGEAATRKPRSLAIWGPVL